jgi:V8-like Glu-specific endopeptidase
MIGIRLLAIATTLALAGLGSTAGAGSAAADPPAPPGTPTASTFAGTPTVGPLFRDGLTQNHECTASVIASPTRDLILTAAHCITGTAVGYQFVPGYDNGQAPYGVWTVTHAYLDPAWLRSQDPQHDYAILSVAANHGVRLQSVTGANLLGTAPRPGAKVTDVAYNEGIDDQPVRCTVPTYRTDGYPSLNCHGYVGGSSGSPWLASFPGTSIKVVQGVIGGLHQGGCFEYTSYSSAFTVDVYRLLLRAVLGVHPDSAPAAGSDGC